MFKKLLVPLDGSALAEQALGQAAAIARASHAEIDVVYVHQPLPFNGFADAPWNAEQWRGEHTYIETIAAELTSGSSVPVTHAVLQGETVDMICERVREAHIDLVVMTSHGRTGLSRAWFGSVANAVIRRASVPVLMVRPIESKARSLAAHHLPKHLLVTLDGSAHSATVLPFAGELAARSGARVTLLSIVMPTPLLSPSGVPFAYMPALVDDPATVRAVEDARRDLMTTALELREEHHVAVEADVVVAAHAAQAIVDYTRANDIDLLAMSTRGRGMSRLFVGSVADKVMRSCGLPMLLFKPETVEKGAVAASAATNSEAISA